MAEGLVLLGRLHPLVLHLPIGFFLLALLLECAQRFRPDGHHARAATFTLAWSAVAATLACITGWVLAGEGDYRGDTLFLHRMTGLGTAAAFWLALAARALRARLYPFAMLFALVLLLAGTHAGGSLTHGEDFLTGAFTPRPGAPGSAATTASNAVEAARGPAASDTFHAAIIQPMLNRHCVDCHGPAKAKGGLRMDTHDRLMKGGEHGAVVVAGSPTNSRVIQFTSLPPDDPDFMPPKGTALNADQIAVLSWWIASGARPDQPLLAEAPPEVQARLDRLPGRQPGPGDATPSPPAGTAVASASRAAPLTPEAARLVAGLAAEGWIILPLSRTDPGLTIDCVNIRTNVTGAALTRLAPLAASIAWLDATGTRLESGSLQPLAPFRALSRLQLGGTGVTDADLETLAALPALTHLNLSGTAVTDTGVVKLAKAPALARLFLGGTAVTTQGLARLRDARPGLVVEHAAAAFPPGLAPAATNASAKAATSSSAN